MFVYVPKYKPATFKTRLPQNPITALPYMSQDKVFEPTQHLGMPPNSSDSSHNCRSEAINRFHNVCFPFLFLPSFCVSRLVNSNGRKEQKLSSNAISRFNSMKVVDGIQ